MTDLIETPNNKVLEILKVLGHLGVTQSDLQRIRACPELAQAIARLIREQKKDSYTLLSDDEAIAWIVNRAEKSEEEAQRIVNGFRQQAQTQGVADYVKIHAEVQPGCTFKRDIPKLGPCVDDFRYLQDWDFPDTLTKHCLVSWIPSPLEGSTSKNVSEQENFIAAWKMEVGLPLWYQVSFGSLNHVAGLVLAYFKATGKNPFKNMVCRTDTCFVDGDRLKLHWYEGRLHCDYCRDYWHWRGHRYPGIAVFAVGVVLGR